MTEWKICDEIKIENEESISLHPAVLRVLFRRGINNAEKIESFLFPNYEKDILDPFLFFEMKKVVERIGKAKDRKEKVLVFGDYDADGVTSTVILREALTEIGIEAEIYIPDKRKEGYGMNIPAIEEFGKKGVGLIVTVDCGITNIDEVAKANELGIDVIIVDHHHVPEDIPVAHAIINPHIEDAGYPFRELAGVGVAFKVVTAIYHQFLPEKVEQLKWFLDLVAIGTVADCVPLLGENRTIVQYGLIVLSKTKRAGLQELFKVGRIDINESVIPDTQKISFYVAPRINAAGRMDHANLAFQLIWEKDRVKANSTALEIEAANTQRQKVTAQVVKEIRGISQSSFSDKKMIFAASEHYPTGIVGLVAGRIADEFGKPAAIFQKGEKESVGSFRSIPQINIIEAIGECSDLLVKFGGHDQAAGVTVKNDNLEAFWKKLGGIVERKFGEKKLVREIKIDEEISFEEIGFELANDVKKMEPFGKGNEEPVFLTRDLIVQELKWLGNGEKHLKLFLRPKDNSPKIFEAIGFNADVDFKKIEKGDIIDLVYNLEQDEWNGSKKLQMRIVDLRASDF